MPTAASLAACASKWSSASRNGNPVIDAMSAITAAANPSGALRPVPTAVPPSASSSSSGSAASTRPTALADLGGVPGELLTERDRRGIHEVGPARLHDVGELVGLARERSGKVLERRQEILADGGDCGETWMAVGITSLDDCPKFT